MGLGNAARSLGCVPFVALFLLSKFDGFLRLGPCSQWVSEEKSMVKLKLGWCNLEVLAPVNDDIPVSRKPPMPYGGSGEISSRFRALRGGPLPVGMLG